MLNRLKKIKPSHSVYVYHGILFFLSAAFLFPFNSTVIPAFIFVGFFIVFF